MSILEKILYCILLVVSFCLINSAGFDICDLKFYIPNDDAKKSIIGHLIQLFSIVILAITLITTVKNNSIFRIEKFYETLMLNINDARFNKEEGINAYIEFSQYYKNQFDKPNSTHERTENIHNLFDNLTNVITSFESYISFIDNSIVISSEDKHHYRIRFYLLFYDKLFWILKPVYLDRGLKMIKIHDDSTIVVHKFNLISQQILKTLIEQRLVADSDSKRDVQKSIDDFIRRYNNLNS